MSQPLAETFLFDADDSSLDAAETTQKVLIDTQERMGMMLDVMPMGLLIHTEQGILFANKQACDMLQISQAGAVGHHFLDFVIEADVPAVMGQFGRSFSHPEAMHSLETRIARRDSSEISIKLLSGRLPWQGTPVIQVLLQDVTDLKRNEERLRRLTITDELTGAYNRRHAFDEASLHLLQSEEEGFALSVLILDVDHFKRINDGFGHSVGDLVLKRLTHAVREYLESARPGGRTLFARIGGEEFLALLPHTDKAAAIALGEGVRRAVEEIVITSGKKRIMPTVSLGLATYRPSDRSFDALLSRADTALYRAKDSGRNRVVAAD